MEPDAPRSAVPQIRELTCLTQDQRIPHVRHGWKWRAVEIWCPGIPEPPDSMPTSRPADMKGADVPPQIVEAAQRGYSMHGAGLVANLIAAAWPEIERQVRGDEADSTLAEFERFTVNRIRLSVKHTVSAQFASADRAELYEEFRERIEQRVRDRVAAEIEAAAEKCSVHEVDGMLAAVEVARGEAP